jgi:hypothetical protein
MFDVVGWGGRSLVWWKCGYLRRSLIIVTSKRMELNK